MPYSETFPYNGANTVYAKPITPGSPPSGTPSWAADNVASGTPASGSVPFTGLTSGVEYWVYEKDPDNPVSANDIVLGSISDPASGGITTAQVIAAIKNDADLGTAAGGLVANAAQVLHVQRSENPSTPGAPQAKRLVNADGDTVATAHEVFDGDAA